MPSKRRSDIRSAAPTRQAEKKQFTGDRFKTLIFHIALADRFLTLNLNAKPERFVDFIVVDPPVDGEITLEIYDGQEYFFGVVEWLEFIQLEQSEQWLPRIPRLFSDFFLPVLLWIGETVIDYFT